MSHTSARQSVLANYAAEYWWQHVLESDGACSQRLLALVIELLTNETNLLMWLQHYNVDTPWAPDEAPTTVYDLASPLYHAALLELVWWK